MIINPILYNSVTQVRNTKYLYYLGDESFVHNWRADNCWLNGQMQDQGTLVKNSDNMYLASDTTNYAVATTDWNYGDVMIQGYSLAGAFTDFDGKGTGQSISLYFGWGGGVYIPPSGTFGYQLMLSPTNEYPSTQTDFSETVALGFDSNGSTWDYPIARASVSFMVHNAESNVYAIFLAKRDDLTPLSYYGNTMQDIIANASGIFADKKAVSRMCRYMTGDFMWYALQDSDFVTALMASDYAQYVYLNSEWGKAFGLLGLSIDDLLLDANSFVLIDANNELLYQAQTQ